jgi:hypothetical protein
MFPWNQILKEVLKFSRKLTKDFPMEEVKHKFRNEFIVTNLLFKTNILPWILVTSKIMSWRWHHLSFHWHLGIGGEHRLGMNALGGQQLRITWGTFWEHPCEHDENNIGNKGEQGGTTPKKRKLDHPLCWAFSLVAWVEAQSVGHTL